MTEMSLRQRLVSTNFTRAAEPPPEPETGPLLVDERPGVLLLTLSRPDDLNSLNAELVRALHAEVVRAAARPDVRVVVITGTGRAFCTGADLKEAGELLDRPDDFRAWLAAWKDAFDALETCPKPVIAALNGITMAGGLELALACDLIVASEKAKVGDGHATYGLVPGGGGSQRLPDAVGARMARWLMYTATLLPAAEAQRIGLVQQVLPAEDFTERLWALATSIAAHSGPSLAFLKRMTRPGAVTEAGLRDELSAAVLVVCGPDAREGFAAFTEKRKPEFPSSRA